MTKSPGVKANSGKKFKNWQPKVRLTVAFEKTDPTGFRVIQLTQFTDDSLYLDGAEELIFDQGENWYGFGPLAREDQMAPASASIPAHPWFTPPFSIQLEA